MSNNQDLIKQAEDICKEAASGPFRMESQASLAGPRYCIRTGPDDVRSQLVAEEISGANAKFFVTARTLLPQLAEALKRATSLEGYREMGMRAATAENQRDEARAELARMQERAK